MPEFLTNSRGQDVPIDRVRPEHLRKHIVVESSFDRITALENQLIKAKKRLYREIQRYVNWLAKNNDVEAEFKNLTLSNFSHTKLIEIKNSKIIEFDENLQIAKQKIDSCFDRWGEGANPNLRLIVDSYFKVAEKGFINKANILGLQQFNIEDEEWAEAMALITKSIVITARKEYIQFKERPDVNGKWTAKNLNFSSIGEEQ